VGRRGTDSIGVGEASDVATANERGKMVERMMVKKMVDGKGCGYEG
jgi:pyridoxine/pyridoxamine 5'-phosphate oxidase